MNSVMVPGAAVAQETLGNLSKDVFERRTSTGSEAFSLFICLDAIKVSLSTFFSLLKTIYPRVLTKPLPSDAKSPLPVDVRRLKTLLLKVPIDSVSGITPTLPLQFVSEPEPGTDSYLNQVTFSKDHYKLK